MATLLILLQIQDNPMMMIVIVGIPVAIVFFIFWYNFVRWVFRINTIVKNQETQIRTLEETVIQNEKIIKLLSKEE